MASLLFLLALLALVGGVALFVADAREREAKAPGFVPPQDPQPEPLQQPPHPERKNSNGAQSVFGLPGGQRRERKAWAEQNGFSYAKEDDSLVGEWHRGPAAGGVRPRDVVTGAAYGHALHVADLAGATVMAVATGAESAAVVEMSRTGQSAHGTEPAGATETPAEDLIDVAEEAGFRIRGNYPGATRRFIDDRVRTALAELPAEVTEVWLEGEWVLAILGQPGQRVAADRFDAALAPLALLADAARVLPPAVDKPLPKAQLRDESNSPVTRPEEPVELPTRRTGGARGDVADRGVGDDDVEAIAGTEHRTDLTRVWRMQKPPSIFDQEDTNE